ncbi:right-handed parallel beta-helix repeat-containing protein [Nitratifractor sp.]
MKKANIYVLMLCMLTTVAFTKEYYVSPSGEGDFTTIQEAVDRLRPGDTLYIKAGRYHERVYIEEKRATQAKPIVIRNYRHDRVIIDGTGIDWEGTWGGLFELFASSHIVLSGLKIERSTHAGIFLDNSHYITVRNSSTDDTFSSGIGVWECDHISIRNNEVKLACNDGEQECITIATSHHVDVTGNEVHHNGPGTNGGEGIDVKQGSHDVRVRYNHVHHIRGSTRPGLYADASDLHTHHILFEGNRIHDITGNALSVASELGGRLEYVLFVNNIVYNNGDGGMIVGGWTADENITSHPVEHIFIINNTFYNVGSEGIYIHHEDAKDIKIYNNIIRSTKRKEAPIALKDGVDVAEVDIRRNLVDSEPYDYGQKNDIVADPLFVDEAHADFHLRPDSPAIDTGLRNSYSRLDYEKKSRPQGRAWDIGAYEAGYGNAALLPALYLLL